MVPYINHVNQAPLVQTGWIHPGDQVSIYWEKLMPTAYILNIIEPFVFVSYKPKYVHEALVNRLVKLAQEKKCGQVN